MTVAFFLLAGIAFWAAIIGLIKPELVVRWGEKRTRRAVFVYYGIPWFIFFVTWIAILPNDSTPAIAPKVPSVPAHRKIAAAHQKTVSHKSSGYSVTNPVSDDALYGFLNFMSTYYSNLTSSYTEGVSIDNRPFAEDTQLGWNTYQQINYPSDPKLESESEFNKRTDVSYAWESLGSLQEDYDTILNGHSDPSTVKMAQQDSRDFIRYFNQSLKEVKGSGITPIS